MKLSAEDLHQLSEHAILAAKRAGALISEYKNQKLNVKNKTDGLSDKEKLNAGTSLASQLVTEVDLLSQEIILNELVPTCKTYDIALLTEETPDDLSRLEKDYFWCIDPLDGTLPFIESGSGFSVSISLVSQSGVPQIGIVYNPVENTLYQAIIGSGVYRNNKLWKSISPTKTDVNSFKLFLDRSFSNNKHFKACIEELTNFATEIGYKKIEIIQKGGAVMNACWVLENTPACYFKFPKTETGGGSLWDYAATTCVFNEIGAHSSDIYGNELDLNNANSTFMNRKGIVFASNSIIAKQILELYTKLSEKA